VDVRIGALLCVTDHLLPPGKPTVGSPGYLGRVSGGKAKNCEPQKTCEVRWFPLSDLPQNLTMTARNAIRAYNQRYPQTACASAT
jgi:hypothetical protein